MNPIIILTTTSSEAEAKFISMHLIREKLAACVNIIPGISSIYRWQGEIIEDNEVQLVIKTDKRVEEDVYKFVRENHSYETPEIISITIEKGDDIYLKWLTNSIE